MPRTFQTLVWKEVRDLLKDRKIVVGMIVVPLLLFPLMGVAIGISSESVRTASNSSSFAVMNMDAGNYSSVPMAYFSALPNVTVKSVSPQPVELAMQAALKENVSSLVVIPSDFSSRIAGRERVAIDTYTTINGFGIAEATSAGKVAGVVGSFGTYLSDYYIRTSSSGLNSSVILAPIALNDSTFLNGKLIAVPASIVATEGLTQSFALPIATFIVLIFAMQIASSAMALEKEQKTFETLLTLPVSRFQILASKLVGSTVIAAMGAVTSIIGFTYYMGTITQSTSSGPSASAIVSPSLTYYLALGVLLFLTLALATAMAIIVSVFSADVRGAQAVVGYLSLPIILPSIMVIFGDFNTFSLVLKAVLMAIPFSYVAIFSITGIFGDLTYAIIGAVYLTAWVVGALYLASRLFNSERILTARFTFGRKKRNSTPT